MYFDHRLWAFTAGLRGRIAAAAAVGLTASLVGVARLAALGWLLGLAFKGAGLAELALPAGIAVAVMLARGGLEYLRATVAQKTASAVQMRLRAALFDHLTALGPAFVGGARTGDVTSALVDGVNQLEVFFGRYVPQLIVAALAPLVLFAGALALDGPVAGVLLAFAIGALFLPSAFHRREHQGSLTQNRAMRAYSAEFLDSIQGLATLKAFGQSTAQGLRLANKARALSIATMKVLATSTATRGITDFCVAGGSAAALSLGAWRVTQGQMSLEALLILLMASVEMFRPMRDLRELLHQGMLGQAAASGIRSLLDAQPTVTPDGAPAPETADLAPCLAFETVGFAYPGGRGAAHAGLSFTVGAGERVAVVGPSGAGKTSILRLLLRLYDPQSGRITLGGKDLRDLPLETLRRHFAVVSQDTYLFHGTVADNLRLGKPSAPDDELRAAAQVANALDFIDRLPQGLDTVIGERGTRLSGGQRQRIAIARALLRDAPILVLDEALSAVDAENEAVIQQALDRLMIGRTTLIVAHRLSSVIGADRILVMEAGQINDSGTHAELIGRDGLYRRLMAEQLRDASAPASEDKLDLEAPTAPIESRFVAIPQIQRTAAGWRRVLVALAGFVAPWKGMLATVCALGVGRISAFIGVGVLGGMIVAGVSRGEPVSSYMIALAVLAPLTGLLHWLESWLAHDMAYRMLAEMRIALYRKLDDLAPAYLLRRRSGDLVALATQDVETVEYFFAHTVAPAFIAVLVPSVVLIALGSAGGPLALALLPFLGFAAMNPFLSRNRIDRLGSEAREAAGNLQAIAVDAVQGMAEIVAFQRADLLRDRFMGRAGEYADAKLPLQKDLALQGAVLEAMTGLGGLAVVLAGAWMASTGALSIGWVPLFALLAMAAFLPVSEIAQASRQLAETYGSAQRLDRVHGEPILVRDGAKPPVADLAATLTLQHVSFGYPAAPRAALEDVSVTLPAGATVALVGPSGAGKTTIAALLLRFFDPATGSISFGGQDLRDWPLEALRHRMALVAQDTYLFNATLRDNILLARPDALPAELDAAIERSALTGFIASLPQGLDTPVGERGVQLSGGQRQRVAIARAFLKDAPVLILDEATSHLDAISEAQVRSALSALMRNRTTLVIAHRLSTVRDADLIVVMDQGRVVESGTHSELLTRGGLYARLVGKQLGGLAAAAQ